MISRLAPIAIAATLFASTGCVTPYQPPTMSQPHAIVKLRRTYQTTAGTHMRESVRLEDHPAFEAHDTREAAEAPRTDAILVHPTTAEMKVAASFFHIEIRTVTESYTVQVPFTTVESSNCGLGKTCTRTVTNYRTETRFRTVTKPVEVSDGRCETNLWLAPQRNAVYLVEYEYAEDKLCRITCFDQAPGAEPGTFQNRACIPPTRAAMRKVEDAR